MNKKNAFTLVELLAVIAILGIIMTLVVPKVFKSIDDSKIRACKVQVENINDAASTYFIQNKYKIKDNGTSTYGELAKSESGVDIMFSDLVSASLLKASISNPVDDTTFGEMNTKINVKEIDEMLTYTIYIKENDEWVQFSCE